MPTKRTGPKKIVLLVEDNADDAELTMRAIRKAAKDIRIVHAHDGAAALDCLHGNNPECSGLPAVVFLDLGLPKVGGLDVLKQLRADVRTKFTPVVVVSSSNLQEDIDSSYARGANGFVRKAVDFTEADHAISTMTNYWVFLNELPSSQAFALSDDSNTKGG